MPYRNTRTILPLLALFTGVASLAASSGRAPAPAVPAFVSEPAGAPATVTDIVSLHQGDAVLLAGGALKGLRLGAICQVSRAGEPVAELLLVVVGEASAAGLLLRRFDDRTVRPGDTVTFKIRPVS